MKDALDALRERHAVRTYIDKEIEEDIKRELLTFIEECNLESNLHMQLVVNEPQAFDGFMAHYGKFNGVSNYIAIVGSRGKDVSEKCGYYGQKVVIRAQQLGLNTCWVALTYDKIPNAFEISAGEKLYVMIAVGYGTTAGVQHKSKSKEEVTKVKEDVPEWFWNGVEAALLAPTTKNQQQFVLSVNENKVKAKAKIGFYSKLDLGIVKYQFELGAGTENFVWSDANE